jgi:hypothetical protein
MLYPDITVDVLHLLKIKTVLNNMLINYALSLNVHFLEALYLPKQ